MARGSFIKRNRKYENSQIFACLCRLRSALSGLCTRLLLYKRQHLEAYVRYCAQQNYRLEKMPAAFEQQHARQIKAADDFVFRFQPQERRAFYAELNRAYAEMEPEMLDKLEQSYNQNRQIYESAGQSFSRYEFCQWLDNHPEILFKGKTDKEFDNN